MNSDVYWIYLQQVLGFGSRKLLKVLEYFKTPQSFYEANFEEKLKSKLFTVNELEKIQKTDIKYSFKIVEKCVKFGYDIITPENSRYPKRLLHLIDPPAALYMMGTLPDIDDEVALAVVGTRKSTDSGRAATRELCERLAKAGALIVSGGAVGIDSSAHSGALSAGGKTVAVLGCGLNFPYLACNEELRRAISENGALISEYPPDMPASRFTFPVRNRIMSGLCLGTIVVEAGEKSGALITAAHAIEQGRDVFVIPGSVMSPEYAGTNRLMKDGAKPVLSALDVLEEYAQLYPHRLDLRDSETPIGQAFVHSHNKINHVSYNDKKSHDPPTAPMRMVAEPPTFKLPAVPDGLSETALLVYRAFDTKTLQLDALIAKSGLTSDEVLAAVTELEIYGIIAALPGGRYAFCM